SSSTSQNLQNVAFVSSNSTNSISSTNKVDNTAYEVSIAHTQGNTINPTSVDNLSDVVICAFLASQPNSSQLAREDLEQNDPGDLEEIDLQWEMVMLTIRARRKPSESGGFEQILDFLNARPIRYALTVNPTVYAPCVKQFWTTAKVKMVMIKSRYKP
nr:hypothetical protein [Tanacetum cinerariifolium]